MKKVSLTEALLNCEMKYDIFQNTFSPIFSSYGLQLSDDFAGIKALYLHYNRSTRPLFDAFMVLPGKFNSYEPHADKVTYKTDTAECEIAFYEADAFIIKCSTFEAIKLFAEKSPKLMDSWLCEQGEKHIIIQGYSENGDARDPDKYAPVMVGAKAIKGSLILNDECIYAAPNENGEIYISVAAGVMNVNTAKINEKLNRAPQTAEQAAQATQCWIEECIKGLNLSIDNSRESRVLIKAIITLIFNLTMAPGNLEGYISSFPNRGGYPTHFMWDSCFQNLAYEKMNPKIAEDSLLQLCKNIRADGKIPQFLCSTWARPHDAQPALLGWAAKRLFEQTNDLGFVEKVFEPLEKNNNWWLTQRMTRFGVISCAHGLETGQDNSPRFDNGTVLAVDMSSYVLNQLNVTAEFARLLNKNEKAEYWAAKAKALNNAMVTHLYDKDKNLFFDAYAQTGQKQSLITSSGLIPLWAGIDIPQEKARDMIKSWLLNPKYFYGNIPFPSVAYTESCYDAEDWWRGPTWMPEAWLMLEILKKYGFTDEYNSSIKTLFAILSKDGVLHELFNSQTGNGMGFVEQGWTAAIYIALFEMLK